MLKSILTKAIFTHLPVWDVSEQGGYHYTDHDKLYDAHKQCYVLESKLKTDHQENKICFVGWLFGLPSLN